MSEAKIATLEAAKEEHDRRLTDIEKLMRKYDERVDDIAMSVQLQQVELGMMRRLLEKQDKRDEQDARDRRSERLRYQFLIVSVILGMLANLVVGYLKAAS